MKNKKTLLLIFVALLIVLMVTGCTDKTDDKDYKDITDLYSLSENDDNTYSYTFVDLQGNILFKQENIRREPKINQIADNVYELITQNGTGLFTNNAVYCDVKNSRVSEIFYYVLAAKDNYVVFADYEDDKHLITVQNIFDKSVYSKTYELENVSPVAADFALGCEFESDGDTRITYLAGEDYSETEITIEIP